MITAFALTISTPISTEAETLKRGITAAIRKSFITNDIEMELIATESEPDDFLPPHFADEIPYRIT